MTVDELLRDDPGSADLPPEARRVLAEMRLPQYVDARTALALSLCQRWLQQGTNGPDVRQMTRAAWNTAGIVLAQMTDLRTKARIE